MAIKDATEIPLLNLNQPDRRYDLAPEVAGWKVTAEGNAFLLFASFPDHRTKPVMIRLTTASVRELRNALDEALSGAAWRKGTPI
jgi:hypothetical protein